MTAQLAGGNLPEEDEDFLAELEEALQQRARAPSVDSTPRVARGVKLDQPSRRRRRRPQAGRVVWNRDSTRLAKLPETLRDAYDDFLERPGQPLILGALALLVGFYLAGALSTVFGAKGFWEPTVAIGPLVVGEAITRRYYSLPADQRSQTIILLNALKCGFYLGIVLDALKLAG